jgi:hypothetical protein
MKWRHGGALLVLLLVLLPATALWAQGNNGAIAGKVIDTTKQPIPGATITVTSKYLMGSKGSATDINGEFMIPYLPPGNDYSITVEAMGFNKVVQGNVIVSLGSTTTLEVELMSGGEVIEVKGRPPAVTLKETKVSTNLSQEELEMLPIGRQYQDTLYLAPTVVGSGMGGNPGVAGSTGTENIFLINGLNTTDPVTGTFGTNLNYNFIREMEVSTGGLEAEYGASTGGLFNVLTKSGTNEFHGEVFAYFVNENLAAKANSTDFTVNKPQPYHNYDYGFDVGGPIVKDRLWFFVGYNPSLFTTHNEGVYTVTNIFDGSTVDVPYDYDDLSRNWFWSAKLNWRINDKHSLEFSIFSDPSHMWYNEGMFPTLDERALHTRRYQGGYNAALKWYATWSSKFFMEVGLGKTHSRLDILPWDHDGYSEPLKVSYNFSPSLGLGAGSGTVYWDDRDTTQLDAKATYLWSKHEIKFGLAVEDLKWHDYSGYTGGIQYGLYVNRAGTSPLSPYLHDYRYVYRYTVQNPRAYEDGRYTALFLQDKWSVTDYVTLSAGIRFERNEAMPQKGQDFATDSWSPRLGITWDFAKNGKSKLFANWGLFYQRTPINIAQSLDPGHASYTDITRNGAPYLHFAYGVVPLTVLPGTKNQYNEEYLFGVEYELVPDFTVGFRAIFRSLGRVLEDVGYIDDNGDISYVLMNPGSDQWPAVMDRWASVLPDYEKSPRPIRNYQGYTLTAEKRFSNRWFLNASYTWSQLKGNFEGGGGGYSLGQLNPNATSEYDIPEHIINMNRYGYLPQDRTHQIKVQGSYKFDFGMVLGINYTFSSGRPMNKYYGYPRMEAGYGTLLAVPRGSAGRMPSVWQLDLHAEYAFNLWKTNLAFFADVFNLFNNQQATSKYQTYYYTPDTLQDIYSGNLVRNPDYGKTSGRQAPRNVRLGVKWSF